MKDIKKCIGRFSIVHNYIEDRPDVVLLMMKDIIVTRAESLYARDRIEYTGISTKYFDEIAWGSKIPIYQFTIHESLVNNCELKYDLEITCEKI